jgi:hypothetical protein
VKGLRVNLDVDTPIASLVLKDTGEEACAVHIHDRDNEVAEPLEALLAGQGVAHRFWKEGEPLPARVSGPRRTLGSAGGRLSRAQSSADAAAGGSAGDRSDAGAGAAARKASRRAGPRPRAG